MYKQENSIIIKSKIQNKGIGKIKVIIADSHKFTTVEI